MLWEEVGYQFLGSDALVEPRRNSTNCFSRSLWIFDLDITSARAIISNLKSADVWYAMVIRRKLGGAMEVCLWYEVEDGRKLRPSGGEDFEIRMSPPLATYRLHSSSFILIKRAYMICIEADPYLILQ
jgi:hypothetical protein